MKKIKLNIQMFASTNKTTNYELPQFIGTDKPSWLGDVNGAMSAIDTAMHTNATTIAGVQSTIQTLSASLDSTNQSVTSLSNSLGTLDGRVTTQGGAITSIDGRVTTLEDDNSINKAKIETNSTYSTDELKVGKWIDDKPIYRKVVVLTSFTTGETVINHNISNIDKVINVGGFGLRRSGECETIPTIVPPNIEADYQVSIYDINNTQFRLYLGRYTTTGNTAFTNMYIIFEYTKTTD